MNNNSFENDSLPNYHSDKWVAYNFFSAFYKTNSEMAFR